jgi:16S rRNA (cytidine1402-2'-O)-methyltransferase
MLESALYIVPTPIGNLEDITMRAVRVLKEATLVAAEDTRHSKQMLDRLGISPARMISCYDQTEEARSSMIIDEIGKGGSVALISDAGSPLINDPGYRVVTACAKAGVKVVPLPGPCAVITALECAGLPTDAFRFNGFFPVKDKELRDRVQKLASSDCTEVFYEAPRRILKTAQILSEIIPDHPVSVCRELTKAFESVYRMKASGLPAFLEADPDRQRGEFVVVVGKAEDDSGAGMEKARAAVEALMSGATAKTVSAVVSDLTGARKRDLYEYAVLLKNVSGS